MTENWKIPEDTTFIYRLGPPKKPVRDKNNFMLTIQKWLLENNGDRVKLSSEYGIHSSQHPKFPNLYQFTYDQIESSKIKDHPMVRECRGIILDRGDNWKVIARPFDRFFNWGETVSNSEFDFSSMVAQEKIDGSLMILYNYNGIWHVATKGSPDAGGSVGKEDFTFAELFWKIYEKSMIFNVDLDPRNTYLFELTSKYNRIVTSQIDNEGSIQLIGIRDRETGQEFWPVLYKEFFPVVKSFSMNTIEEILEATKQLDPSKQEGFVLVDKNFNRLKVKSEKYVLIHHLKDSINDERIVELIKTGEDSEVFAYFPDLKIRYDQIKKYWNMTAAMLDEFWEETSQLKFESQKDFALFVQYNYNPRIHSFFYMIRSGKVKNATEWLMNLRPNKVLECTINLE